jgi:membrane-anchored protein YejM (alkaline phosphatase superfamily)
MTTLRQAAELALDAMKDFDYDKRMATIEAVELALAETEQGPDYFALTKDHTWISVSEEQYDAITNDTKKMACYTAPPQRQWVGLTEDDIDEIRQQCGITHHAIKTIEAKLKELNHDRT